MNYQDTIKDNIRRAQIKSLIIYVVLLLISASGMYACFTSGQTVRLLDLIPVSPTISGIVFVVITAFLLAVIAQTLRSLLHKKVYTELFESIKKFGNPETIFEHVGKMPKCDLCIRGDFRCDRKYVAFTQGDLVLLQPTRQIVWGYVQDTASKSTSRKSMLPESKPRPSQDVTLRLIGRQTLKLHTKSVEDAEKLLAFVQECCPGMTSGYSVKYESIYAKNPENLRKSPTSK